MEQKSIITDHYQAEYGIWACILLHKSLAVYFKKKNN